MTPIIITFSGMARSGKDTLIKELEEQLSNLDVGENDEPPDICNLSSIFAAKEFMYDIIEPTLGLDTTMDELTVDQRNFLGGIKQLLDVHYNWTTRLAIETIEGPLVSDHLVDSDYDILLYQVREHENLMKLKKACKENDINFISVFVMRKDRPDTGLAFTEMMGPEDFPFDIVISTELGKFPEHAKEILDLIVGKSWKDSSVSLEGGEY